MVSINLFTWLLAISPVIIVLLLMTAYNWGGRNAGMFTWLATQLIASLFFGASFKLLQYTLIKAFFLSLDVLLIIWSAMFLYRVTKKAGTIQIIGKFLSELTENRAFLGIFLGWLFPSFLQGVGGFGVPVAVSAPLLVSAGFSPILSVVIASIGHGWGVTFGSMGSSFKTLMAVTGLSADYLAPYTAFLLGISSVFCGLFVIYLAGGKKHFLKALPLALLSSLILSIGQYFLATNNLWVIAVTLPAIVNLGFGFLYVRFLSKYSQDYLLKKKRGERIEIMIALFPYLLLVSLVIIFNFFSPLRELLTPYAISLQFPQLSTIYGFITPAETSKKINLFLHPGSIITISALISYVFLKKRAYLNNGELKGIAKDTFKNSLNTSIAIFSLVGTAVVMNHAQMTNMLAVGISRVFNHEIYPLISPFIGALGAFITGSNTNSNVLFGTLQQQTAELLNLPVALILASQTAGGALGSITAPAKIMIGCSTVGLDGKEGKVISKLILYSSFLILLIGIFTYSISRII
ncbi:MAG: L-lactate permease [Anaerolineaceae bacterium]|nr:L-lactate permease [Anaerolineaceae bacterium]